MDQPATKPVTKESPPAATEADAERRWPLVAAFLTVWLLPATTARRLAHVSLLRAWLFHLAVMILIACLVIFLIGCATFGWPNDLADTISIFLIGLGELMDQCRRYPVAFPATVAAVWSAIEVGLLVLAFVVMPWGAVDEPLGQSYRNALRQTWLQCAQVIACVLLVGGIAGVVHKMASVHTQFVSRPSFPTPPSPPALAPDDPSYQQAMTEYQAAMAQYAERSSAAWEAFRARRARAPWYVRSPEAFIAPTGFVAAVWLLWGLLRGVGARRNMPRIVRPPTCEFCGYNLMHIPMDSRCPECGQQVSASLGPDVRPGVPWEGRRQIGRWETWWLSCCESILRPTAFGCRLRLIPAGTHHRRFFAIHLPIIYLIGAVGAGSAVFAGAGVDELLREPEGTLAAMSAFGCVCAVGTVMFTLLGATLVGVIESLREKRNLLPGAMQAACYLGTFLTAWALFGAASGITVIALGRADFFRTPGMALAIDPDMLAFLVWFVPNVILCVAYFGLLARATAVMRYANR